MSTLDTNVANNTAGKDTNITTSGETSKDERMSFLEVDSGAEIPVLLDDRHSMMAKSLSRTSNTPQDDMRALYCGVDISGIMAQFLSLHVYMMAVVGMIMAQTNGIVRKGFEFKDELISQLKYEQNQIHNVIPEQQKRQQEECEEIRKKQAEQKRKLDELEAKMKQMKIDDEKRRERQRQKEELRKRKQQEQQEQAPPLVQDESNKQQQTTEQQTDNADDKKTN